MKFEELNFEIEPVTKLMKEVLGVCAGRTSRHCTWWIPSMSTNEEDGQAQTEQSRNVNKRVTKIIFVGAALRLCV